MFFKAIKSFINKIIFLFGYKISNLNYFYDSELNLIRSINFLKIKSIIDVGANEGQFVLRLIKKGFKGNVLSFEPVSKAYNKLLLNAKKIKNILHGMLLNDAV